MKDIESSDLISKRYISEIDEVLVSTLNLSPSFPIGVFMVLQWSGALMVHQSHEIFTLLFRELCIMKLRPRLYMGLSSISSVMIISTQYSIH